MYITITRTTSIEACISRITTYYIGKVEPIDYDQTTILDDKDNKKPVYYYENKNERCSTKMCTAPFLCLYVNYSY